MQKKLVKPMCKKLKDDSTTAMQTRTQHWFRKKSMTVVVIYWKNRNELELPLHEGFIPNPLYDGNYCHILDRLQMEICNY